MYNPIENPNQEGLERLTQKEGIFTLPYGLEEYERFWLPDTTYYRPSAEIQAQLAGGIQDNQTIVDLGCGPGNSLDILVQSNPNLKQAIGIDPSFGSLLIAKYKFNQLDGNQWQALTQGLDIDPRVRKHIREMRRQSKPYSHKIHLVQGRADQLPLSSSVDRIHLVQSLQHWMALADQDKDGKHIGFLLHSLHPMRKTLKQGGLLIFDESGFHFDFKDRQIGGIPVNDLHVSQHPFNQAFAEELQLLLDTKGYPVASLAQPQRPNRYYRIFNLAKIKDLLDRAGLELQTINGVPYQFYTEKRSREDIIDRISGGSPMIHFVTPELIHLSDETKGQLIQRALEITQEKHGDLLEKPALETFAFFVAQAV